MDIEQSNNQNEEYLVKVKELSTHLNALQSFFIQPPPFQSSNDQNNSSEKEGNKNDLKIKTNDK